MIVYVVEWYDGASRESSIDSVWADKQKAQARADEQQEKVPGWSWYHHRVLEFEVQE